MNEGLSMGFERLVEIVPNIQKGTYYLIGGATGSGKTAFTDDAFLYNPYDATKLDSKVDVEWIYYSFEIDKTVKIVKGIARKLYYEYGILVDVNYVLSRGKNRISSEVYDKVMELRKYFEELEDKLTIFDLAQSPTKIKGFIHDHAKKNGKIITKSYVGSKGNSVEEFDRYEPNNPNKYTIVVVDHISLTDMEKGKNIKDTIDALSQILVPIRNNYDYTPVVVQQLTFDSQSVNRRSAKRVTPVLADFGDSKYTTRDANIAFSLFNPYTFEMSEFNGYDISLLEDRFRGLEVLKNRDGDSNMTVGLKFIGEVGTFTEYPRAKEMTEKDYRVVSELLKLKPNKDG
jgi:KaiC/GvpD/RAD55 family RecA-like ATPase